MQRLALMTLAGVLALAAPAFAATMSAKPAMTKLSGVIASVAGNQVEVTAASGQVAVTLSDKTRIALSAPIAISEIKPGSYVGAGAQADGKGGNTAVEITVFPESARGLGEGFRKWDEGPNSTMTNGTVSQVVGTASRTITVTYKGGRQSVTIPPGTPIVTFAIADKSALVSGAHIVVRGFKQSNGGIAASFVSVGKDGSIPPG